MNDDDLKDFLESISDRRKRYRLWRAIPLGEDSSCEEARAFVAQCLQHLQSQDFDNKAAVARVMDVLQYSAAIDPPAACIAMIGLVEHLPELDHANFDAIDLYVADANGKGYGTRLRVVISEHPDARVREHFLTILDTN